MQGPMVAILLAAVPFAACLPTLHTSHMETHMSSHVSDSAPQAKEQDSQKPWMIFSMREQPFEQASLSFTFLDPNTEYTTDCKTSLPMSGYSTCEDGKTSFIYGGVSFQFGETWLSIQRPDALDCSADANLSSTQTPQIDSGCTKRAASGHLNLPNNFWQQPGWNSWVHPESLELSWNYAS
ncbi:hypothetical protein ANO11243_003200 [Dothideomycetidae sp. 11243]|nr:hypothetical protein ANO11243_003200 [fungal sp. No.11243]